MSAVFEDELHRFISALLGKTKMLFRLPQASYLIFKQTNKQK